MNKALGKKIKEIPQKPGVYLFKDKTGRIIYIGKAINIKKRVRQHFVTGSFFNAPHPPLKIRGGERRVIADIDWIKTDNEKQALLLENELIKKYQPRYNIQWRDDKSYFWVTFTDDEWPRVRVVHQSTMSLRARQQAGEAIPSTNSLGQLSTGSPRSSAQGGLARDDSTLIGPFVNGRELRRVLRALRKIIPYRTCKNPYEKPCLQWHLGLCAAHNPSSKLKVQSSKLKKNYLNLLNMLSRFLRLYAGEPIRIEAYDISNIQGKYATGSMIVFYGNKPSKSDYRKFRIKAVPGANDTAMIREIIRRRLNHSEWPFPDLILVDGGKAQLGAAASEIRKFYPERSRRVGYWDIGIIALAKREEEIYTEYSDKPLKLSQLPESLRLTCQAIRNEAHRFAIFYYRYLHRKNSNNQKTISKQ